VTAALRVRPADAAWAFALRAGLAVAVPLAVLVAVGHTGWAPFATFGAFAALYGRDELYRRRAVVVGASALGLVVAVVAGGLAALASPPAGLGASAGFAALASPPAGVAAVAIVGGVATLFANRYRVGPPAGLMFAFATAVCAALPTTAGDLPRNAGLAAAAALVARLIVMSGALITPGAPRRLAVARALRAAAALHAAPDGPAGLRARHQAALAVERAWRAAAGDPLLEVLAAHAETELSGVHGHSAEAAAELRDLADRLPRRTPTPAESAKISERHHALVLLRDRPHVPGPLGPAAVRVAIGALVAGAAAGLLTHLTGLGHPYWAAVSAVAVLQAASLRLSAQRALQRAGGTIVGLLIAGLAVAVPGGPWVLVAEIVAAQVVAELLVIRNYGLAMLAVTPLALLVGELGHRSPPLDLIGDRLIQTVLGCVLGLATAALVTNRAAARHLAAATAAVEEATSGASEPRRLALLVATMREAYEVASGEPGLPDEAVDRVLSAERKARSALAALSVRPGRPTSGTPSR
jgi:hypothetical protein